MAKKKAKNKITHSTAMKKADQMFSRLRRTEWAIETGSLENGGYFRCVTCGKVIAIKNGDCGHCVPRGVMETRFDKSNTAGQCTACNRFCNGQTIKYLDNIKTRLGETEYNRLIEADLHKSIIKYTTPELYEMAKEYQEEVLQLWSLAGEDYPWAVERFRKYV